MKIIKPINWIFFDAGGALLDETQWENQRINLILRAVKKFKPDVSIENILTVRTRASAMLGGLTFNMIKLLLDDEEKVNGALMFIKDNRDSSQDPFVRPEAKEVVEKLAEKYNLGLLANQPVKIKEKLERARILQYFKFQNVSEDFNLRKPDPEFFKAIFKTTGADPKTSAIIDDNIERGLIPAKKFGMTTVWYNLEEKKVPEDKIDFTIKSLNELLEIFL